MLKAKSKSVIFWVCRAIRHPASGYVQGINDLVTPFLVIFLSEYLEGGVESWSMSDLSFERISDVEADCYWCLTKLLDGMQDHYTFAQPGIQRLVFKLKELVRRIDGKVPAWLYLIVVCLWWFDYLRRATLYKFMLTLMGQFSHLVYHEVLN